MSQNPKVLFIGWVHLNVLLSFLLRNEFLFSFHTNQYLQLQSPQSNMELRLTFKLTIFKQEIWTWSVDYSLCPSNKTRFIWSAFIIFLPVSDIFPWFWPFHFQCNVLSKNYYHANNFSPYPPFLHLKLVQNYLLLSFLTRKPMVASMWI